ncbi:hypothetical protein [Mesorhizobium sp. M1322]|uniref:hypothetical protein n=1 Tax=Mesorhizobium sp. M1322 TaxID=2957081 RepID=UPI00333CF10F
MGFAICAVRLATLEATIEAKPDQSAAIEAQTFLTTAQLRLTDYRDAMRKNEAAKIANNSARSAYDAYCRVMEDELNALYDDVQEDFGTFYRLINEDDEAKFTAKLTPSEGRLDFDVNFYERGLFPPGTDQVTGGESAPAERRHGGCRARSWDYSSSASARLPPKSLHSSSRAPLASREP